MTDKELLDWLEHNQATVTNANHKFIIEIRSERDTENYDSLRLAIEDAIRNGK